MRAKRTERVFDLSKHCFDKQRPFATSAAKYRTACCSRRSGKTEGAAGALLATALSKPGSVALYITKTRINAKRIIWGTLKRINEENGLGGQAKEADLCIELLNGSRIYLVGANNRDEIEKFRGLPIAIVVLDEAQALSNLEALIDEVLSPALMDYDGAIALVGTPGPVPTGYFWDCVNSSAWEHHHWTAFDNPWMLKKSGKTAQQHLDEELKRRGVPIDYPSIQREWFGRWVYDPESLVFKYEASRNHYDALPDLRGDWECVVSGDLGWDDADALVVLRWNTSCPDLWVTEEHVMPKQTITTLGNRLREMVDRVKPLSVVLDFGGLGKKIAQELTQRWSLHVEAADKERKLEHIELLNDALRTGILHAKKDSTFAKDCMLVEWDRSNPEKPKISDRYHSDACDAVLYGYRRARQWLHVPEPEPGPKRGSMEWSAQQAARVEREIAEQLERDIERATQAQKEKQELGEEMGWI